MGYLNVTGLGNIEDGLKALAKAIRHAADTYAQVQLGLANPEPLKFKTGEKKP